MSIDPATALARILALHTKVDDGSCGDDSCCSRIWANGFGCSFCGDTWPCETVAIATGLL